MGGPAAVGRPLAALLCTAPVVGDAAAAEARLAELRQQGNSQLEALLDYAPVASLIGGIAAGSAYLWTLIQRDPARCAALLESDPHDALRDIVARLERDMSRLADHAEAMRVLRLARQEAALLVGLADLGGVWPLAAVTASLTVFAEAAVATTLEVLVRDAVKNGRLRPGVTAASCGLVVLALGKAGGGDLNYSSDIDFVVIFDPEAAALAAETAPAPLYVKMTQSLARLLQENTADGFVLRVDLRLRPDPASTAVAVALPAALHYYETLGQNWERAAFIKARPIAGDVDLGAAFLRELVPFIWRKYFDYAAIADIHAMKRQINAAHSRSGSALEGRNLKLGHGGIREIEFFVQTQQLIFGGRRPVLRGRDTCAMLAALAEDGWIDAVARDELTAAYVFLRTIEHRLQMMGDRQTHTLPAQSDEFERLVRFSGFADRESFSTTLVAHLQAVERHYARLFEHAPSLGAAGGDLVFTGTDLDPGTVATLRTLGYRRPEAAVELVRGWHFGRRSAMRSARAREVLTELVPALLDALARSADPDGALAILDTVLARARSAVELLSLLRSSDVLRDLFADVLGSAPSLAAVVAERPHVLDAAIDPTLLEANRGAAAARLTSALAAVGSTEEFLDRIRDLVAEESFLIGLRTLTLAEGSADLAGARSDLADAVIRAALDRCVADFSAQHGHLRGGGCIVLGLGKLGSKELSATSDLDLIVIYRCHPDCRESDGARPLDPSRYYTRLTQRLVASLTAPTRRGGLYEVDMRLRPSGRHGPLAIRLAAFAAYHDKEAQTWEHMALTRARVVAGDAALAREVERTIADVLGREREIVPLRRDVAAMRTLVAREKPPATIWDMKLPPGGLLDVEFAAQYLQLAFVHAHPTLLRRHPAEVLAEAERLGLLPSASAVRLLEVYRLQSSLVQLLRLVADTPAAPDRLSPGAVARICRLTGRPTLGHLVSELIEMRMGARAVLECLLQAPLPDNSASPGPAITGG